VSRKYDWDSWCGKRKEHNFHSVKTKGQRDQWCHGWHEINRLSPYKRPVTLKPAAQWVLAKTGALVHAPLKAEMRWFPNLHEYGWAARPQLRVKSACKYPSWLSDPILLTDTQAHGVIGKKLRYKSAPTIHWCQKCVDLMS
jgi:hypothetical protein